MILDAKGQPVPPAAPPAVLPVVFGVALLAAVALAAWGAWTQAGALGVVVLAVAVVLHFGAA